MLHYKALSGVEIQHWQGQTYLWTEHGVYSFRSASLHKHKHISRPRQVEFHLLDRETGKRGHCITSFAEDYDDWEIINRYTTGTGKCDCQRGRMIYGENHEFPCNLGDNRFILQKMVIKGEDLNCVVNYRGYL